MWLWFILLGGNIVFVKCEWFVWFDGWDVECLVEDCELGVCLLSVGVKVVVVYSFEVVMCEEILGLFGLFFK